jgi:hypothetical protein
VDEDEAVEEGDYDDDDFESAPPSSRIPTRAGAGPKDGEAVANDVEDEVEEDMDLLLAGLT